MKYLNVGLLLVVLASQFARAQSADTSPSAKKKGTIYFTWGYHRDAYTKSTIRFQDHTTDNYDFTFHNAKARDQPDWNTFCHTPLPVPQFSATLGYILDNEKGFGIELSSDHLKYVIIDNQVMHVSGNIRGTNIDKDTLVTPAFVHYEHTNGNNYWMVNIVKKTKLIGSRNGHHVLNSLVKGGAGILLPKTESVIMGGFNDGPYKVAGWVVGASVNLRYDVFKYFFLEASAKGCFADFVAAKLLNDGKASQHFFSVQYIW